MTYLTYTSPIKCKARKTVLEHAVSVLTAKNNSSRILRKEVVKQTVFDAAKHLESVMEKTFYGLTGYVSKFLNIWEENYSRAIQSVCASELKVLILAGSKPSNDVLILQQLGIESQNIVAIEKDSRIFEEARCDLVEHNLDITLIKSSLADYLKKSNDKFHIVYFDACGPFMGGKPNTLSPLIELVVNSRLEDNCVVISNYSQVPEQKLDKYSALCTGFFAPRYNDTPKSVWETELDPHIYSKSFDNFYDYVRNNINEFYSDFITRFSIDIVRNIIPASRFLSDNLLRKRILNKQSILQDKLDRIYDIYNTNIPADYSNSINKSTKGDPIKRFIHEFYSMHLDNQSIDLVPMSYPLPAFIKIAREVSVDDSDPITSVFSNYSLNSKKVTDMLNESAAIINIFNAHPEILNNEFLQKMNGLWFDSLENWGGPGFFCDLPLPNIALNCVLGKYGYSYNPVVDKCFRFKYTAQKNTMYCDCFVLDSCREFYDIFPSIENKFKDWDIDQPMQLLLRSMISLIGLHDFSSSTKPFWGGALFGVYGNEKPYHKAIEFSERYILS